MSHRTNAGGEGAGGRVPSVLGRAVSLAMMSGGLVLVALFFLASTTSEDSKRETRSA